MNDAFFICRDSFAARREGMWMLLLPGRSGSEKIAPKHHVLFRTDDRITRRRFEEVCGGDHERARFFLRLIGEGNVQSHLVSVEVCVERGADKRMELDCEPFDEDRLEGLNAEAMERGSAVEEDVLVFDHVLQDVPYLAVTFEDEAFRCFHIVRQFLADDLTYHKRFEELHRHFLRQSAVIHFEIGTDDNHGAARVIDALAEEVLAESSLFSLEHVREGAKLPPVARGKEGLPRARGVIEERIHCFLQHAFLVAADYFRRADAHELFEAVIAVDDAAVEIVQIAPCKASSIELHHRPKIRRDHGEAGHNHPLRFDVGAVERRDQFEALHNFLQLLAARFGAVLFQKLEELLRVDIRDDFTKAFRPCSRAEKVAELHVDFAEFEFREHRTDFDILEIKEEAEARRRTSQEPDVSHRHCEVDVRHPFTADDGARDFHTAFLTNDSGVTDTLVLAAEAL